MFEIPENIIEYFFNAISTRGKYEIIISEKSAIMKPQEKEEYYKPIIIIKDLMKLKSSLENFVSSLNKFYIKNNYKGLQDYHDLCYFFNSLFFNMTVSDALDLAQYIDKRSYFLNNDHFSEYDERKLLISSEEVDFYVQRRLECPGLETPYILIFSMEIKGKIYELPLVRYAIDENKVCHLFAIQFGRNRDFNPQAEEYKKVINQVNSGVKKYRNVSPSFVMIFRLFIKILEENNINKIMVPDYLFSRYKNYYKAQGTNRSDLILTRILNHFITLLQRMEYQYSFFEIKNYPNEIDSFSHIYLKEIDEKNKTLIK